MSGVTTENNIQSMALHDKFNLLNNFPEDSIIVVDNAGLEDPQIAPPYPAVIITDTKSDDKDIFNNEVTFTHRKP